MTRRVCTTRRAPAVKPPAPSLYISLFGLSRLSRPLGEFALQYAVKRSGERTTPQVNNSQLIENPSNPQSQPTDLTPSPPKVYTPQFHTLHTAHSPHSSHSPHVCTVKRAEFLKRISRKFEPSNVLIKT